MSNSTVSLQRRGLEADGQLCESHTTTGVDGKTYPRHPVCVFNPTKREERALSSPEVVELMQTVGQSD